METPREARAHKYMARMDRLIIAVMECWDKIKANEDTERYTHIKKVLWRELKRCEERRVRLMGYKDIGATNALGMPWRPVSKHTLSTNWRPDMSQAPRGTMATPPLWMMQKAMKRYMKKKKSSSSTATVATAPPSTSVVGM